MGKQQVVAAIEKHGLIAVLRKIPDELLLETAQALYDGGVRVCEVAFCPDGSVGDEKTAQQIAALSEKFGDIMTVGAGTFSRASRNGSESRSTVYSVSRRQRRSNKKDAFA